MSIFFEEVEIRSNLIPILGSKIFTGRMLKCHALLGERDAMSWTIGRGACHIGRRARHAGCPDLHDAVRISSEILPYGEQIVLGHSSRDMQHIQRGGAQIAVT